MLYEVQMEWIHSLQNALRSSWMDTFFKVWNLVDTPYFSIAVIVLVWYLWDRRIGMRLFYILVLSLAFNKLLKDLFHQPRPCQIDPSVGVLCGTSFGFPSGAAQSAAIFCGFIFIECKRWLYRWLSVVFAFFLCFSRVYLGVHYPSDILGGLVVGSLLVVVYGKLFPLFEKTWKRAAIGFPFFLLFLWLFTPSSWVIYLFFTTLGVAMGLISYEKLATQKAKSLRIRGLQVCSVIGGLAILFVVEQVLPFLEPLWDFGKGYWLSFLGAWLIQKRRPFTGQSKND